MGIKFTWNPKKAEQNFRKHKVRFKTAEQVFYDPYLRVIENVHKNGEQRYMAIGRTEKQQFLAEIYLDYSTDEQEHIHIVSAWEAEDYEQRAYADQF